MSHDQISFMKYSGVGVVAAFGVLTMSSSLPYVSVASMNPVSIFSETSGCFIGEETICNSSMLSNQAIGDIVSEYVKQLDKIKVNLQITKITKHLSHFDFEDEYEEL